jgi:hypothetical protein
MFATSDLSASFFEISSPNLYLRQQLTPFKFHRRSMKKTNDRVWRRNTLPANLRSISQPVFRKPAAIPLVVAASG